MKIELEIGENLKESIVYLIESINKENDRLDLMSISPGKEIRKAFGMDFTKMVKVISSKAKEV